MQQYGVFVDVFLVYRREIRSVEHLHPLLLQPCLSYAQCVLRDCLTEISMGVSGKDVVVKAAFVPLKLRYTSQQ